MKITAEDLQALYNEINKTMTQPGQHEVRDMRVTNLLIDIYDRGYEQALKDREYTERDMFGGDCPYSFAHTRHWCGYDTCRES